MSGLATIFLMIIAPLLAALLAWLGWQTLPSNWMGLVLLGVGIAYLAGALVFYWRRGVPFWNPKASGKIIHEEKSDFSFWPIIPGMLIAFYISPAEYLWLPATLPRNLLMQIAGLLLVGAGAALFFLAIRENRRYFSGRLRVTETQELVQSGPYRLIRHPAYASYLLISLGIGVGYSSMIGISAVPLLILPAFIYRIRVEEDLLVRQFGERYREYAAGTVRLIPGIW